MCMMVYMKRTSNAPKNAACRGKRRYSQQDASKVRWRMVDQGASLARVVTYRCHHCTMWHVGHRPAHKV